MMKLEFVLNPGHISENPMRMSDAAEGADTEGTETEGTGVEGITRVSVRGSAKATRFSTAGAMGASK